MKRVVLMLSGLLLCLGLSAQTRTCRYWFDGNFGQSATASFSGNSWDGQIDVSQLPDGLHTLHYYVTDSTSTPVYGTLFHKVSTVGASALEYRYWFDYDDNEVHHGTVGNGVFQIDVNDLASGMHTLHITVKDDTYSATRGYLFVNNEPLSNFTYHAWFDEDIDNMQSGDLDEGGKGESADIQLDMNGIPHGEHELRMYLKNKKLLRTLTPTQIIQIMNDNAVDENESGSLVVYPNPAKDRLTIENEEVIRQCEVYSITGELVFTYSNGTNKAEFSVEFLPAGTYFLRLVTDSFTQTRPFVKE